MSYVRSFAPWIAYAVAASVLDWRVGAALALAAAIANVVAGRRQHGGADDLAVTTVAFFAGLTVLAAVDPTTPLHSYLHALSLGALGLASVASLARRQPFTLAIAKRSTPPELWEHPEFVEANVTITRVWAASFLTTAAVCATLQAVVPGAPVLALVAQVVGFVVPMRFTERYVAQAPTVPAVA